MEIPLKTRARPQPQTVDDPRLLLSDIDQVDHGRRSMRDDQKVLIQKLHIRNGRDALLTAKEKFTLRPRDTEQTVLSGDFFNQRYLHLIAQEAPQL